MARSHGLSIVVSALLLSGLWTPVAGSLIAVAVALVMLGTGARSVDARLYGWRRIDVRDPRSDRL